MRRCSAARRRARPRRRGTPVRSIPAGSARRQPWRSSRTARPPLARALRQRLEAREARLRSELGAVALAPEHAKQRPHLRERLAARRLDRRERGAGPRACRPTRRRGARPPPGPPSCSGRSPPAPEARVAMRTRSSCDGASAARRRDRAQPAPPSRAARPGAARGSAARARRAPGGRRGRSSQTRSAGPSNPTSTAERQEEARDQHQQRVAQPQRLRVAADRIEEEQQRLRTAWCCSSSCSRRGTPGGPSGRLKITAADQRVAAPEGEARQARLRPPRSSPGGCGPPVEVSRARRRRPTMNTAAIAMSSLNGSTALMRRRS